MTSGFESSTDFIYAYRVKEVRYRRSRIRLRDINRGDTFSVSDDGPSPDDKEREMVSDVGSFEVVGISRDEVQAKNLKLKSEAVMDELEGECSVVLLNS